VLKACRIGSLITRFAAGLSDILSKALPNASTPLRTEPLQRARFFNYRAAGGAIKQLWFDDVESLTAKYSLAAEHGLLGVGPWTFDMVSPPDPSLNGVQRLDLSPLVRTGGGSHAPR
jgi:spore germination protein YaaH